MLLLTEIFSNTDLFEMVWQFVGGDNDVCVFADLKFHSSSRMKPRWLAFALTLPTDDVLFVQYTVPTIVMSRQCDQHNKVRDSHVMSSVVRV